MYSRETADEPVEYNNASCCYCISIRSHQTTSIINRKDCFCWILFSPVLFGYFYCEHNQYQHSVRIREPVMLIMPIAESVDVYRNHLFVFCLSALNCYCFVIFASSGHSWTGTDVWFFLLYIYASIQYKYYQTRRHIIPTHEHMNILIVTPMSKTWIYNTQLVSRMSRLVQIDSSMMTLSTYILHCTKHSLHITPPR